MNKLFLKIGFCLLLALACGCGLVACGNDTPTPGGGLTPYVVVVTPTPDPSNPTVQFQASAAVQNTPATEASSIPTTVATTTKSGSTATPTTGLVGNVYTVQKGDTLLIIANKFGVDVQSIIRLNNIADADNLHIDQKLQIPPSKPKITTPAA